MLPAGRGCTRAPRGHLLASFTGEHVGEPRLIIALYGGFGNEHGDDAYGAAGSQQHR